MLAYALTGLGRALLGLDAASEALPHLERALALRVDNEEGPTFIASTRFMLARALWDAPADGGRDRARARELGELAESTFVDFGEGATAELAEVREWLAGHEL